MITTSAMEGHQNIRNSRRASVPIPHGRGKRRDLKVAEILNKVLNAKTEFRERGKLKKASRIELSVRRLAASALKGDVGSAASLLKMRAHVRATSPRPAVVIRVVSGYRDEFR